MYVHERVTQKLTQKLTQTMTGNNVCDIHSIHHQTTAQTAFYELRIPRLCMLDIHTKKFHSPHCYPHGSETTHSHSSSATPLIPLQRPPQTEHPKRLSFFLLITQTLHLLHCQLTRPFFRLLCFCGRQIVRGSARRHDDVHFEAVAYFNVSFCCGLGEVEKIVHLAR